ncbi:MAG: hypothetical protein KBG13_04455 [Syntrophaceae bacterium]|jgi:hypothetical protein|nr:hypothetical protein [Syntrophaceae bacterium]OQC04158.1 MAG: hypothetical protein BWX77_00259 [Bacteroidetes bacterium ADurb.Bin090]
MRNTLRLLLITLLTGLLLCSYSYAAMKKTQKPMPTSKGAEHKMKTYYMGRFAIDLPEDFKLEIQSNRFRLVEIEEYPNLKDADQKWKSRLSEIEKLKKPEGVKKIIIKEQPIERLGKWARGVLYYGDYMFANHCNWDFMVSYESKAVLFSLKGGLLDKEKSMYARVLEVSKAYSPRPFLNQPTNHPFYTEHGVIELPYKRQESTYARFAGPMEMKLEIDMSETHEVEKVGILESLAAALATNFVPGVDVEKIRGHKRTVAGLKGEELVTRITADMGPKLYFGWKYNGKEDSGEHPEIRISIQQAPDGNLDEKIKLWDAALDSFRPAYKR